MAKFTALLLVALAATLVLADAARTTVTVNKGENPTRGGSMQRCMDQFQQQQNLYHCMQYMMGGGGGGGGGSCRFGRCYEEDKAADNQRFGQQHFRRCCEQLEDMDSMCRCEGLRMLMERQMGQMGSQQEMRQMASNLPAMCNLSPGRCQFGFSRWD